MAGLIIHPQKIPDAAAFLGLCPFGAIVENGGRFDVTAACKMCGICQKKGPPGAVEITEDAPVPILDKAAWKGIAVYVDHLDGEIHPVTYELVGKARELAAEIGHPVYALFMGSGIQAPAEELLHYGVDEVFVYDDPALERFKIEPYTSVFADFVDRIRPSSILVGATTVGRQLAPRAAARLRTGLTADCTVLEMSENTDLVQIRPAFGGNIMAQILTPNHRPQIATVRYKVMSAPERDIGRRGRVTPCSIPPEKLRSRVEVLGVDPKPQEEFIETAQVLVVAGRGVARQEDLEMLKELAELLGGKLACTRPLAEKGWIEPKRQIGLSGRTVRPKLLIACGVSGAIQFLAGMQGAECIVAINRDEKAPIFQTAHYGLVGDLYEIVPRLIESIRRKEGAPA